MKVINRFKEVSIKSLLIWLITAIAILTIGHSIIYTALKVVDKVDGMQSAYSRGI